METRGEDGPCGGPTSVSKKMIFERIATYEAAFSRSPTGMLMAKFLSYLSEPEKEVLRLMNLEVEDKMIMFVSKVVDVNRQVDASALSTESLEAIIKALNEKISAHAVTLAGYMADMTERKNFTISQWATVLMQKVTDAAMHADVFTGYNNSSAEVEMLRQQVRDLERAAEQRQPRDHQQQRQPRDQTHPPEHRFNGVCNNCSGYGHLARDCPAPRRPEGSGKGNGRGGHQGVQPAGKGGGGKGDAGGRGRGRAVAAVNNSAPGPHGPTLTDAQFDRWLLTQRH